ncbi:MAG: DUF485 domain-containing protein [Candidatus Methylophosphatis roskildensis]
MHEDTNARLRDSPKFRKLVSTRSTYSVVMTLAMIVVYFGYILLVAFNKDFLAQKLGAEMVTSIGILMGVGVLLFAIIITGLYVRRSNTEFDSLKEDVIKEANKP